MTTFGIRVAAIICLLLGSITASGAFADDALPALDRLQISAGLFSNELNVDGRVDGRASFEGSERDFDDTLGFAKRRSIDLIDISWRPFERHSFGLRHYRDSRSRTVRLEDELRFDGDVFPFDAEVRGRASFSALEFNYTGWLKASERSALGIQLGALRLSASLSIRGEIESPDLGRAEGEASVSRQLYAPLIGISGRQVLGPKVRTFFELKAIQLRYDGVDGRAYLGSAGIEYFPVKSVGLVLQYADTRVKAEQSVGDFNGRLDLGFRGPQALLRWRR